MVKTILFVYNADGSLFSSLTDAAHKIISPGTYSCNLCALTYGSLSLKKEWKQFVKTFPVKVEFLHRDEFRKQYSNETELPSVFKRDDDKVTLIVSSEEINKCKTIEELKQLVKKVWFAQ